MRPSDPGRVIPERLRTERRRAEVFRKGVVTHVDTSVVPYLATIEGRTMPYIEASIAAGDVVFWVDQPDAFAWAKTDPGGGPIWLCTTIRGGDSTWTSLGGDTRTLDPVVAAHTADGGIVLGSNIAVAESTFYDNADFSDLSGVFQITIDASTWWTYPDGYVSHDFFDYADWNFAAALLNPAWWDTTPDPTYYALSDGLNSPNASGVVVDPSSVGLSGFTRGRFRIVYDPSTGDSELFIASPTGSFLSQGTATLAAAPVGSGFAFGYANPGFYASPANWSAHVLHEVEVISGGSTIVHASNSDINAIIPPFEVGVDLREENAFGPNNHSLHHGQTTTPFTSAHAISPYGAPLFLRVDTPTVDPKNTYNPKVFTDGDDLGSPAIAWADRITPGLISIANTDPKTWEPSEGTLVYAVADLDGFSDITSGWPTGYWPFGSIIS